MSLVEPGTIVFVVDDDPEIRQGVVDVLAMEGYDARPFARADAAWQELVAGARPAAIIVDGWLPGMTSGELIRRVRASPQPGVPVIVLSGARAWEGGDYEVDAICRKIGDATTLVRTVDRLVRSRAAPVSGAQDGAGSRSPRCADGARGARRPCPTS
jgi:DNA-binding response OmpR family regulator